MREKKGCMHPTLLWLMHEYFNCGQIWFSAVLNGSADKPLVDESTNL